MSNGPKFDFFEIVRCTRDLVDDEDPEDCDVCGLTGAVLGMAEDHDGTWGYAVHIYDKGFVYSLPEDALEATGRKDRRENFYTGESIRVVVDPKTGEGKIVD